MMAVLNALFDQDLAKMKPADKAGMLDAGTAGFARLGLVGAADALVTPTSMGRLSERPPGRNPEHPGVHHARGKPGRWIDQKRA